MKIITLLTITVSLMNVSLHAENFQNTHCEAARRLIEFEGGKSEYVKNLREGLDTQIQLNPQISKFRSIFTKWQDEYLSWENFEPHYIDAVCGVYSEDEIKQLVDFYSTDIGTKLLAKQDDLMKKIMSFSQRLAMEHQPELQIMIRERMKELQIEVKSLFPEWSENLIETHPMQKEFEIHQTSSWVGGDMQNMVFVLKAEEIIPLTSDSPFDGNLKLSVSDSLDIAYNQYFRDLAITRDKYEANAKVSIDSYLWRPDSISEEYEEKRIWFYEIDLGFGAGGILNNPPSVLVLQSGNILKAKKKVE